MVGTTVNEDFDPYAVISKSPVDYQSFIKVAEFECSDGFMELPKETDGTVLLSTVTAQFANATGLKYKSASGNWRGIRAENNILAPPDGGWGDHAYYVTGSGKRKTLAPDDLVTKLKKRDPEKELLQDLIVKSLPLKATEKDLSDYFSENCGDVAFAEVKFDATTKESRGFGFIRFSDIDSAKSALSETHVILGQQVIVQKSVQRDLTLKLFVGRLPEGTTTDELRAYFERFGELTDAFVPRNFRGFGFVTYADGEVGRGVLKMDHKLKENHLNVTTASPKDNRRNQRLERETNGRPDSRPIQRTRELEKPAPAEDRNSKIVDMLVNTLVDSKSGRSQNYGNSRGFSNQRVPARAPSPPPPPKPQPPTKGVNNEILNLLTALIGQK